MGFAHAFMEDVLGRLLMVAVLGLLMVGTYELVSLKNEVRELRSTIAAQNETPAADEDAVADDNDDESDDQDNDEATVEPDDSPDAIYQRAQDAYVHGQYQDAIDLSEHLTEAQPGKAWRIMGASSCFLRDKAAALKAYRHLDGSGKQFLAYVCSRNDITLK
jgi:hypothetical protein